MIKDVSQHFLDEMMNDEGLMKNSGICRFFMQISGEVVLRAFLGSLENKQFMRYTNGKLLSQELAEIVIDSGRYLLSPDTIVKGYILKEGWWLKPRYSFLLTKDQRVHKERLDTFKSYIMNMIEERFELFGTQSNAATQAECFVDLIVKESVKNGEFSKVEILQQFMSFFFAGMDTTGITTAMTMYCLAKYTDKYEKVVDEIKRIMGPNKTELDFEDISKFSYLHAFIKEVLRIHSTVSLLIPRQVTRITQDLLFCCC